MGKNKRIIKTSCTPSSNLAMTDKHSPSLAENAHLIPPPSAVDNFTRSPSLAEGARGWVDSHNDTLACHTEGVARSISKNSNGRDSSLTAFARNDKERDISLSAKAQYDNNGINPNLPQGWTIKTLGEVLSSDKHAMKRGPFGSSLKKEFFVDSGIRVFEQYNPINQDSEWKRYFITQEKFKELESFKAGAGDLLISCSGTLGKILELPQNVEVGIINQALLKIRLDNKQILNSYFVHLFNSPNMQRIILENTIGSAIQNIASVKILKQIKIPLPPLDIQKRIVSKLDEAFARIDNGVAHLKSAQNNIAKYKQSLLKAAFSGTLTDNLAQDSTLTDTLPHPKPLPQGEGLTLDSPAIARGNSKNSPSLAEGARGWVNPCNDILSCHTERSEVSQKSVNRDIFASANASQPVGSLTLNMTNDENPNLPQGWTIKTLGEVFKVVGGGTPATSKKEFWRGNIAWITSADIDLQGFTITPKRFITNEAIQSSTTNLVEKDTIVVVTRVGLGKVGITDRQTCFSQDSQALIPLEDLDVKFMAFQIKNQAKNFLSISRGTTISGITKNTLKKVKLVVPPLQTQKQIVEILEKHLTSADKTSEFIESALNKAKQLKSSLLKSAFEGKLV